MGKATVQYLGEDMASRVPVDYFFIPRPADMTREIFLALPLQWDWPLLGSRLDLPMGSFTTTPDSDFATFRRRADDGGLPFTLRPVMICDAMAAYPGSDFVVQLAVPEDVRRQRARDRDRRWGTVVADRWQHLEETWRIASRELNPDLLLDGIEPLNVVARDLARTILELPGVRNTQEKERS